MTDFLPITRSVSPATPANSDASARKVAEKLEASFLAEMLKSAGLGTQENSFSGGIGEEQFASFQRQALAEEMVKSGGIGLAESFYQSIMEKRNDV